METRRLTLFLLLLPLGRGVTRVRRVRQMVDCPPHTTTVQPSLRKWAATIFNPELLPPQGPPTFATLKMRVVLGVRVSRCGVSIHHANGAEYG